MALGEDIFTYFGMGCRNVTKLFIPAGLRSESATGRPGSLYELYQHNKYGNNVDYYRTIYLMNQMSFLDNGVILLKEDPAIASPVGVVFYERYSEIGSVQKNWMSASEEIQCVVSSTRKLRVGIPTREHPGTHALGLCRWSGYPQVF